MPKESAIALGKLKATFRRQSLPDKFSRLVSLLLNHLDRNTYICWPSRRKLAELLGCSEKTLQRNLGAIRELGLFEMETIGADEMRCRVGIKTRVTDRHTTF
jgi:AraC-like DNA-binding protein